MIDLALPEPSTGLDRLVSQVKTLVAQFEQVEQQCGLQTALQIVRQAMRPGDLIDRVATRLSGWAQQAETKLLLGRPAHSQLIYDSLAHDLVVLAEKLASDPRDGTALVDAIVKKLINCFPNEVGRYDDALADAAKDGKTLVRALVQELDGAKPQQASVVRDTLSRAGIWIAPRAK